MVVRWTFTDDVLSETYTFEVNPKEGGSFPLKKKMEYLSTTDPTGRLLMFEGRDEPRNTQFSGTILSQEQYEAMETWFSKRYWITMTDDLGRPFSIYILGFDPKRRWALNHPWRHDYTVECVMVQNIVV